jgi:hypothetical protein
LAGAEQVIFQPAYFGFGFFGSLRAIRHACKVADPPPTSERSYSGWPGANSWSKAAKPSRLRQQYLPA